MRALHYDKTVDDVVTAAIAASRASKVAEKLQGLGRPRRFIWMLVLVVSLSLFVSLASGQTTVGKTWFGLGLAGAMIVLLIALEVVTRVISGPGKAVSERHFKLMERAYRENRVQFYTGPVTIRLTDEGIELTTRMDKSVTFWPFVQDATVTPTHVLLQLPLSACLAIPNRAFTDGIEATDWVNVVRSRARREHQGSFTSPPTAPPA